MKARYNVVNNIVGRTVKSVRLSKILKIPYDNTRRETNRFFIVTRKSPITKKTTYIVWDGWDHKLAKSFKSRAEAKNELASFYNKRDPI